MNYPFLAYVKIYGTSNNTILVVTDPAGNIIYRDTGGKNTKAGRLKGSAKLASTLFSNLNQYFEEVVSATHIIIEWANRGAGYSTNMTTAVKLIVGSVSRHYNVINIIKTTPFIHGQIRPQKPKRR
jgi:ribosomal protein S11